MLVHCCLDSSRPSLRQNKYSASFGFRLKIDQHNNFIVFGFFGFVLSLISLVKTLHTFPSQPLVYNPFRISSGDRWDAKINHENETDISG